MVANEYVISIELPHTKEEVWKVITDFSSYRNWNTVLRMFDNEQLELWKKFNVTIHNNGKDSTFKATTLTKEANNYFSAQQIILGKWFFAATHYFLIEDSPNSKEHVLFIQKWHLTGLIASLFKKQIYNQLDLFKKMNTELKMYLEHKSANVSGVLDDSENY